MKILPHFKCVLDEDSKISFDDKTDFNKYLADTFKVGDILTITVEKYKSKRSLKSNKYYWLILNFIAKEIGYNKFEVMDLHTTFKTMFLPKIEKSNVFTGETIETIGSTRILKSDAFSEYVNEVKMYAEKELNIIIPDITQIDY